MIENTWLFPALETLHLIGMALFLGPLLLGDLRVLGVIPPLPAAGFSRMALAMVLITGVLLFTANPGRYLQNPAFLVKLVLLVAVAAPRRRGMLSLALWSLLILVSRAVIDFDV